MEYTRLEDINQYKGEGINPLKTPDKIFELYSVPEFDSGRPEVIKGRDIGSSKATVKKNDILLCKINPRINRVWVVGDYTEYQSIASSEWIVVRNNEYNPEYLAWYFRTPRFKKLMTSQVTGIGGSLTRAQPKQVKKYPVPVLNRNEQDEVVNVLNKADEIIAVKKKELEQLDTLIKARFVELFGDPILNPKGFPVYRMDEVVSFQGGSQPDKKYFEYEPSDNNIRLIQIRDYKTDNYKTYIPKDKAKRFCTADDIMIGRYGPPIFQILQGIEGSYNVALMKATPKMGRREFIRQFLKQDCLLHYLEGMSKRTAGQDGIQMDKLKAYPVPLPPDELQVCFENFKIQVDKSKSVVQKSLDETQVLFDSLMQKYFASTAPRLFWLRFPRIRRQAFPMQSRIWNRTSISAMAA
ncbi:MAG: restriction endonuclease subunit S, partial [Lachnospiraceae bacterium]|nr:restriction endonuclease subunit S [Lachnospiraceae bacterium]